MLEMNAEIRAQWCKDLRSGEFSQTDGTLRNQDGMCCLGVLTHQYVAAGNPETYDDEDMVANVWENGILAEPVREWAGLDDSNPDLANCVASWHNDILKSSFDAIADLIDDGEGRKA